jgi:hypothetical protein
MAITEKFVLNALLRHNYLPNQKKLPTDIPPIFTTRKLVPSVARKLVKVRQRAKHLGWDAIEFQATRFNGVARILSIPHPLAYARLCLCIADNWPKIGYIVSNKNSMIRPRRHSDHRLFVMDYDSAVTRATEDASKAFGRRFIVHTDITNCYPSIYSHAVPWAVVGFPEAKQHKTDKTWYNELDEHLRKLKRNETQGVAIGPGTSNIVTEAILARVDESLRDRFVFRRYIDDYTAFCSTDDECQEFVRLLARELARYKLLLNIKKTEIKPLPLASAPEWLTELSLLTPKSKPRSAHEVIAYLNLAVDRSRDVPDGSVLKYAIKTLLGVRIEATAKAPLLLRLLELCYHHPALLPTIGCLMIPAGFQWLDDLDAYIVAIAKENARLRRSDGTCWALYYMKKLGIRATDELATSILDTGDCLSLLLLHVVGTVGHKKAVVEFAKQLGSDPYELDQHWLLLYQLYFAGAIRNPYKDEEAFPLLKQEGVTFLR